MKGKLSFNQITISRALSEFTFPLTLHNKFR